MDFYFKQILDQIPLLFLPFSINLDCLLAFLSFGVLIANECMKISMSQIAVMINQANICKVFKQL